MKNKFSMWNFSCLLLAELQFTELAKHTVYNLNVSCIFTLLVISQLFLLTFQVHPNYVSQRVFTVFHKIDLCCLKEKAVFKTFNITRTAGSALRSYLSLLWSAPCPLAPWSGTVFTVQLLSWSIQKREGSQHHTETNFYLLLNSEHKRQEVQTILSSSCLFCFLPTWLPTVELRTPFKLFITLLCFFYCWTLWRLGTLQCMGEGI